MGAAFGRTAGEAEKSAGRISSSWSKLKGTLGTIAKAAGAASVAVGAALGGAATKGIQKFAKFQDQMNEVFTLVPDMSETAMGQMSEQVKSFAVDAGRDVEDVTNALYQSLSAGIPPENVFDFMEKAHEAALGGVTDLTTAVDGLSSVVNAYGQDTISSARASDLMFTAVKRGKTTFGELSASLARATPMAAALGVKFGDVTAALATMTAQGTSTAEATTQLRSLLTELSKSGTEASKAFEEVAGVGFADFIAQGHNLQDAMVVMRRAAEKAGVPLQDMFGNIRAGTGVLQLTGKAAGTFSDNLAAMQDSAGATAEAAGRMNQSLARSFEQIRAAVDVAFLNIGDALEPFVASIAQKLIPVIKQASKWLSDRLPSALEQIATAFGDIIFVFGEVRAALSGVSVEWADTFEGFLNLSPQITKVLATLAEKVMRVVGVAQSLAAEFKRGLTATGNVLFALEEVLDDFLPEDVMQRIFEFDDALTSTFGHIGKFLQSEIDRWRRFFVKFGAALSSGDIAGAFEAFVTLFQDHIDNVTDLLSGLADTWGPLLSEWLSEAIPKVTTKLKEFADRLSSWIGEQAASLRAKLADEWIPAFVGWVTEAVNELPGRLQEILTAIESWLSGSVGPLATGLLNWLSDAIGSVDWASLGSQAAQFIFDAVSMIVDKAGELATKLLSWFADAISAVDWSKIGEWTAKAIFTAIAAMGAAAFGALKIIKIIVGGLVSLATSEEFHAAVVKFASALLDAVGGFASGFVKVAVKVFGIIKDKLGEVNWGKVGQSIIDGILGGLGGLKDALVDRITGALSGAWSAAMGAIGAGSPSRLFMETGLSIMRGIAAGLEEGEAELLKTISDLVRSVSDAFESALGAARALAGGMPRVETGVLGALSGFVDLLLEQAQILSRRFRLAGNFLDERLVKAIKATADVISRASGALSDAAGLLRDLSDMMNRFGSALTPEATETALEAIELLTGWSKQIIQRFQEIASDISLQMLPITDSLIDTSDKALELFKTFLELMGQFLESMTTLGDEEVLEEAYKAVATFGKFIHATVKKLIKVANSLNLDALPAVQTLAGVAGAVFQAMGQALTLIQQYAGALAEVGTAGMPDFGSVIASLIEQMGDALDEVKKAFGGMDPEGVYENTVRPAVQKMVESWAKIVETLANAVDSLLVIVRASDWESDVTAFSGEVRQGVRNIIKRLKAAADTIRAEFYAYDPEDFAEQRIRPAVADILESWGDALELVTGVADDLLTLAEAAKWESAALTEVASTMRQGVRNIVGRLKAAADTIRAEFYAYDPEDFTEQTIRPAVKELLENWGGALGLVAAVADDLLAVTEAAEWEPAALTEVTAAVRQGVRNIVGRLKVAADTIRAEFERLDADELKERTIRPGVNKMLKSWEEALGIVASGFETVLKLVETELPEDAPNLDQAARDAVDQALSALTEAAEAIRDVLSSWSDEKVAEKTVRPAVNKMLESWDAALGAVASGFESTLKILELLPEIDIEELRGTLKTKFEDVLVEMAEAVTETVDVIIEQRDITIEELKRAEKALEPLAGAVSSAAGAIRDAVDIGQIGIIETETEEKLDKFDQFFQRGLSRLKTSIGDIADALQTVATDPNFLSAAKDAASIESELELIASEVEDVATALSTVFAIGLAEKMAGEEDVDWDKTFRQGINKIQGFLDDIADVLSGVTMPDVDLDWLVSLFNTLAAVVSGGSGSGTEAALATLESAASTITGLVNSIVDAASGKGVREVDTTWLEELFELLAEIIEGIDLKDPAKDAIDKVGVGLMSGLKELGRSWQLRNEFRKLGTQLQTLATNELSGMYDVKMGIDATITDVDATLAKDVTYTPPSLSDIESNIETKLGALALELDVKSATGKMVDKPTYTPPSISTIEAGIEKELGSISIEATINNATANVDVDTTYIPPKGIEPNIVGGIESEIGDIDILSHIDIARGYADKRTTYTISPTDKTEIISGISSGLGTMTVGVLITGVTAKPSAAMTTNVGMVATPIALAIQDAVNTALGASIAIDYIHISDWWLDEDDPDLIATDVQSYVEEAIRVKLGRSIDIGKLSLAADQFEWLGEFAQTDPFLSMVDSVGLLDSSIKSLRAGQLMGLRRDLVRMPRLQPAVAGPRRAASTPAPMSQINETRNQNNMELHIHTNAPIEPIIQDFKIMESMTKAMA